MKLPLKERVFLSGVVIALAAVLAVLAVLQYRWAREVSDATSTRLQANLQSSMMGWRDDLYRELAGVFGVLQADPALPLHEKAARYAQQYQTWSQSAAHSNLISHLFLVSNAASDHAELFQLNTAEGDFQPAQWPQELEHFHNWLQTSFADRERATRAMMRLHTRDHFRRNQNGGAASPGRRPQGPDVAAMVDVNALALMRLQFHHFQQNDAGRQSGERPQPVVDWIVVELDRKVLDDHILPELTERHFSGSEGLDYQVAVTNGPGSVIYSSDSGFGKQEIASPDGTMPVFGPPRTPLSHRPMNPPPNLAAHHPPDGFGFPGGVRLDPIHYSADENDWQLLVRHRMGGLEAVVAGIRRRNLELSFGVLLVLAAGIGIIVVTSQRARMLARLQMDFVASVSHELRTPLAVISSAAENIADGVVAGRQQLAQYGGEIKNQAKHLIQLVEQILLFAATRGKRHHYTLRPLRVSDVIDAALKDTAGMIDAAGITVEQDVAPNLPPIMGDLAALSHCLQNLITNAVKYGGDARWMRIKAGVNEEQLHFDEVQISVEDKGLGIGASELRHIFEPFYRSRAAAAAQIHGTGLGLSLARDIAEAMGGRLTVSSEPGKGSCFTVYLKFAEVSVVQATQTAPVANPNLSKT